MCIDVDDKNSLIVFDPSVNRFKKKKNVIQIDVLHLLVFCFLLVSLVSLISPLLHIFSCYSCVVNLTLTCAEGWANG